MQPKRMEFEEVIYNISAQFVKLQSDEIDEGLNKALEELCKNTNTVRSSIFIFSNDLKYVTNIHEWCKLKSESQKNQLQNIPSSSFGYYIKKLKKYMNVVISSMDDLPEIKAKKERAWSIKFGFRPLIFVPMISREGLYGALGLYGRINENKEWSKELISLLRFTANMIMNLLERKKAEDKLKSTYINLHALIENTDEFILISDKNAEPILWNSSYAKVMKAAFGIEMKQGLKPHKLLKDKKIVDWWDKLHKRVLNGEKFSVDYTHEFEESNIQHFEISYFPIKENNKVIGFSEYARDITERKNAEIILKENELLLRTIAENLPNSFISIIKKGYIFEFIAGEPFEERGIKSEDLTGQTIEELQDTNTKYIKEQFEKTFNGERTTFELKIKDKYLFYQTVPLKDEHGNINRILNVVQNITELKNMEEQLRQSEKMQAIGQLAGGIAHDFNNQLAAIVGFADLLREEVGNNKQLRQYAENILIASKRSADLTNQLLAFARKGKYISVPVDIHLTIIEVISLLTHTIDKRIIIKHKLIANPSCTIGDPTQLQNMLLNLALNARDAIFDSGELIFSTDTTMLNKDFCLNNPFEIEPGEYLIISVSDTGTGIAPETQKHIFEPFFTTKKKGIGMGLAAVYGTIKSHKGAIKVISEQQGTTFNIYLPLASLDTTGYDKKEKTVNISKGTANILFIDDEILICNMASEMLTNLGYTIDICYNGKDALKNYENNSYDIVIIDMIMPKMGGKDIFLEMKKINPEIAAIFSSGYNINTENIFNLGIKGFIQKPYRKSELSKIIMKVLNGK